MKARAPRTKQQTVSEATFTPSSVGRQAQLRVAAGVHERDMFELIQAGAYEAIECVFNTTRNTSLRRRALGGFRNYAVVASYYHMHEHFDVLLVLLCRQFLKLSRDQGRLLSASRRADAESQRRKAARRVRREAQRKANEER